MDCKEAWDVIRFRHCEDNCDYGHMEHCQGDECEYYVALDALNKQHYADQTEPSFKVDGVGDADPTIHAIAHLQKVGWLQKHDRALTEQTEQILDDGTLVVNVVDATRVGRVLVSDSKHNGGLYYADAEPKQTEPKGEGNERV